MKQNQDTQLIETSHDAVYGNRQFVIEDTECISLPEIAVASMDVR